MLRRMAAGKLSLGSTVKLNSGYELPLLGFGVREPLPWPGRGVADAETHRSIRREAPPWRSFLHGRRENC